MPRVTIDHELCSGAGRCEATYPAAFEVGDDMKSRVRAGTDANALDRELLLAAARACPWGAISIEGEELDEGSNS